MNRSILIVTPFFAPQSHAAVFRAYKLAKYLPDYGWKPYIVTVDINYLYNEDAKLLQALPPTVEIHQVRYIEPSIRGVRMALGSKDRTFKTQKSEMVTAMKEGQVTKLTRKPLKILPWLYRYMLDAWLQVPDAYWTWENAAFQQAKDLMTRHRIPLVLTSAKPFTSFKIGYHLKKELGVSWVADFRDPTTHSYKMISRYERVFLKQRHAEKLAVQNADAITVLAESYALILTETYGLKANHPIHFITTGLDDKLLKVTPSPRGQQPPYLIFVGEFVSSYDDEFFRIFARALERDGVAATGTRLLVIGRLDVNSPRITPIIRQYGLEAYVDLLDHMAQDELYQYLCGAKAALLIPGRRALWWNLYAKLVDYIALEKPVLAIVPDPSEARMHLQRSGLGVFLDGDEDIAVRHLSDFLLGRNAPIHVDEAYCGQFLVQCQVNSFVELFERLVGN